MLNAAAKSFVTRLLLFFFLVNKMIERWNGEMAKLQNILKHGMSCCEKQKFYKNGVVMKSEIIYS